MYLRYTGITLQWLQKHTSKETSALQRNCSNMVHQEMQMESLLSSPVIHLKVWSCILGYFFKSDITSEIYL